VASHPGLRRVSGRDCCRAEVPASALRHILEKHYDLAEHLGAPGPGGLAAALRRTLCSADEAHGDRYRRGVVYCLKRSGDYWVNIVVVDGVVKTAYLINAKTYRKFREKRWL